MISQEITLTIKFNRVQRSKAKGVRATTVAIYCRGRRVITKSKASEKSAILLSQY